MCRVSISFRLDSSIILKTEAIVLPTISSNLPSCLVDSSVSHGFTNICLADPRPFHCRFVDMLLGADLYPRILLHGVQQHILSSLLVQNTIFDWILSGPISCLPVQVFTTTMKSRVEDHIKKYPFLNFADFDHVDPLDPPRTPINSKSRGKSPCGLQLHLIPPYLWFRHRPEYHHFVLLNKILQY